MSRQPSSAAMAALGAATVLAGLCLRRRHGAHNAGQALATRRAGGALPPPREREQVVVTAARRLNRASGTIATSALLDSALEHYRGSYHNKAMYTPLLVSAATLAVSIHGTGDKRGAVHHLRDAIYAGAAVTGLVGTGFHLYNVGKRTGGLCWQNLFYGSPLGAPASIGLAGLLGYYSERLRASRKHRPRVFGLRAGHALAALSAVGLLATSAEAGLLHLRGAYHDPFMWVPVTVPPVAAALLLETATNHPRKPRRFTRWWLGLTALVGTLGSAFHVWGVHRNMGGWHNWRQNLLNGPPIPAPPSFTGLALAGLAALRLLWDHPDA